MSVIAIHKRPARSLRVGGDPGETLARQAKATALIEFAAKVQDWNLLIEAIDAKIEDQREFVAWWDEHVRRPGGDNRSESINSRSELMLLAEEAHESTGIRQQQVSRWRKALADPAKYRERIFVAACQKADLVPAENHRAEGTGENEWFTPEPYIQAAREVMGDIDLDPATHPVAQQRIGAARFFTRADNGLAKEWRGRVWLNPPYAQPLIGQFVQKLVEEFTAGRVAQAVLLTHNYTDTAWFHAAEAAASLICFTRGRIRFLDVDGDDCSPTQGQAFFYYGSSIGLFREQFGPFGFVR